MSEHPTVSFVADPASLPSGLADATGSVVYRSAGACLLIGPLERALDVLPSLPSLSCTILVLDAGATRIDKRLLDNGVAVFDAASLALEGYLGAFTAIAAAAGSSIDLAVATWRESGRFDLVLDLADEPIDSRRLPPLGYLHLPAVQDELSALAQFDVLTGEFDKPRYFDWRAQLCVHQRSSLPGCSRCLEVCVAGAITSAGDGVRVDPYLCQGCGSCATVCPTGAMRYAYPPVTDAVHRTRELLAARPVDTLVLHVEADADAVRDASLAPSVLDLVVEEVSAFGLDYWLTAMAGGIGRLVLVLSSPADDPNRQALEQQADLLHALLGSLSGIAVPVLHFSTPEDLADTLATTTPDARLAHHSGAAFEVGDTKRQTLRAALDTLAERHPPHAESLPLPNDAPFGRLRVDTDACTLCMACVSTCPAGALLDGQDRPALRFIEANCVQCGLCEQACPEAAIGLEARYLWDSVQARRIETLHEEEPFHCVRCHKAFATQGIIDTMRRKLAGHWMFSDPKARRRLEMCEDCRVKDLFENEPGGPDVHRGAPASDEAKG